MECDFRNTMTRTLLVVTVLALCAGTLWAQGGTGELSGLVTDQTGAVIANAQVTLSNTATGDKRTSMTTPAGIYRFVALPVVGAYTLEMSPKGFKSLKIANIVVTVGAVRTQDLKLEVGATTEEVTVEAGAQAVQTTESSLSELLNRRVWQNMPLETRSQNEFMNLLPGVVSGGIAFTGNGGTDRGAVVNGTRSGTGNFLVEGFDNNDQGLGGGGSLVGTGGANTTISPDAIEEYRVIEHNFSAEFGKAGGFVTDTVLRSGTNQFHGSLFEYNRVQALAANSFFSNRNNVKDSLVRNQFGGSIGGPIIKDRTFFFFTAEFHRLRTSSPLSGTSITPDFLNFVDSGAFQQFMESDPNGLCNLFNGASCPGAFADSSTLGPIFKNTLLSQPIPFCVPGAANCDTNSLDNTAYGPWAGAVGLTYPVPVYGFVTVSQPSRTDQTRYTSKMDHRLGANDQLNGSYIYDNADNVTEWAGGSGTFGPPLPNHGRAMNAGITWSHTFSPTVLNQARVSYTRHTGTFPGDSNADKAGIPAMFTAFDPTVVSWGNASNLPQFFTENAFNYRDDLSVTRGKHNFKVGASYGRTRNGSSFQADKFGLFAPYSLEDLVTDMKFDDNADFAIAGGPYYGSWYYAEASIDPTKHPATRPEFYRGFRANEVAAYFQDDWRITNRLTLNLGVRWDYFGPPHNFKKNIDSNFYTGVPITPVTCPSFDNSTTPPTPIQVPCTSLNGFFPDNGATGSFASGTLQVKNSDIWHKDTNNFAPRFGFAWDTFGNQKLVVRGGYGVAYDRMYNNIFENIRFNPPFFCFCSFGAIRNGVPGGGNITPGVYGVPFNSQGAFNDPNILPVLPKTSPRAIDQNLVTAYYQQFNFGFQYELRKDFVLETNYVGTLGHKLLGIINLNTYPGRTAGGVNPTSGLTNTSTRPNPNVNNINLRTNGFSSNYHAFQASLRKHFSHGLQFNANYTYSKVLDEISDTFTPRSQGLNPQDSLNVGLDRGPADFDVKHRFVVSYSYDLPFFKENRWIGGWALSGAATIQTGVPFSVWSTSSRGDSNKNGTFNDRLVYTGSGSISSAIVNTDHPADGYFDPAMFGVLGRSGAAGVTVGCPASVNGGRWCEGPAFGQSSRNALRGPGFTNWDFGLQKKFKITEGTSVAFFANFFNLFNHPNFNIPDGNKNNGSTFGSSTSTYAPGQGGARVTQMALRFDF